MCEFDLCCRVRPEPRRPAHGRLHKVFEQYILVGQGGEPGSYLLLNRSTGTLRWSNALVSSPSPLNYAPAFNNDIVLLGGSTTTSVAAVQASTGDTLWTADRVGASDGHFPILTNDLALYEGRFGVVAARPSDGMVIWQNPSTAAIGSVEVAKAPLSVYGSRVYGIAANGNLFALDLLTGEAIWSAPMIGADGSNVIATRKYVYVNDPSTGTVNAIRTSNGSTAVRPPGVSSSMEPSADPELLLPTISYSSSLPAFTPAEASLN
ncbi:MAG: PQQ-binding-like beta-propeller repeat protein [Acidobacteriota bacterium]